MTPRGRSRLRITVALVGLVALVVFGWFAQRAYGDAAGAAGPATVPAAGKPTGGAP